MIQTITYSTKSNIVTWLAPTFANFARISKSDSYQHFTQTLTSEYLGNFKLLLKKKHVFQYI